MKESRNRNFSERLSTISSSSEILHQKYFGEQENTVCQPGLSRSAHTHCVAMLTSPLLWAGTPGDIAHRMDCHTAGFSAVSAKDPGKCCYHRCVVEAIHRGVPHSHHWVFCGSSGDSRRGPRTTAVSGQRFSFSSNSGTFPMEQRLISFPYQHRSEDGLTTRFAWTLSSYNVGTAPSCRRRLCTSNSVMVSTNLPFSTR